jgi:hypothetical protein
MHVSIVNFTISFPAQTYAVISERKPSTLACKERARELNQWQVWKNQRTESMASMEKLEN